MDTEQQGSPSYYSVLGVASDSNFSQIKRAYRRLAMQWHPDRWTRNPSLLTQAKRKFQEIQEAYSVLSDQEKRALYDLGLYDPAEEEEEGYSDFVQEMVSLIAQERRQKKTYNMEELQTMFIEMVQGFQQSPVLCCNEYPTSSDSKRARCEYDSSVGMNNGFSPFSVPRWGIQGTTTASNSYCK